MGNTRRFRNAVGQQIREQRIASGLSQDRLAVKLQLAGLTLDRSAVAKIESGLRSVFDYELAVIARCLGISADALFPTPKELREILPALLDGQIAKAP